MAFATKNMARGLKQVANVVRGVLRPEEYWCYQYAYGHREILVKYMGLPTNTFFLGDLQHGWSVPGTRLGSPPVTPLGAVAPRWTWNRESDDSHHTKRRTANLAIGAPWLYMLEMSNVVPAWMVETQQHTPETGVIFVPTHHYPSSASRALHSKYADRLRQDFQGEKVTVLLAMSDFLQLGVRELYETPGFAVTCAGMSGYPFRFPALAREDYGDRIRFLWNLHEILMHNHVLITDGVGTHVFYAASLGLEVHVWPKRDQDLSALLPPYAPVSVHHEQGAIAQYEKQVLAISGDKVVDHGLLLEQACLILGAADMRTPDELAHVMTWRILKANTD